MTNDKRKANELSNMEEKKQQKNLSKISEGSAS